MRLSRFLEDPKLALDNNYAERAPRIIALGRKSFLFAGSVEHAQNLAILQSVVLTCLLHGVNPYEYIRDVIVRLRDWPSDRVEDLLPWNWAPPPDLRPGPTASEPIPEYPSPRPSGPGFAGWSLPDRLRLERLRLRTGSS